MEDILLNIALEITAVNPYKWLLKYLYDWQALIAALIGAGIGATTPVLVFYIKERTDKNKRRKEHLLFLEKNIVSAINNLSDIDNTLYSFVNSKLKFLIQDVEKIISEQKEGRSLNQYAAHQAFIPFSSIFLLDNSLLKETSDSAYIENLTLTVIRISMDMPEIMRDIHRQFDRTLSFNQEISILKLNSPIEQNKIFLDNLKRFELFINSEIFQHNIPLFLRRLVSLRIALAAMNEWGFKKWRKIFNYPLTEPVDTRMQKVEDFFKDDINSMIKGMLEDKMFNSRLLLIGEEPPERPTY